MNPNVKTAPAPESARITDYALEVRIAAPSAAVWRALTTDIARWWPSQFYCGAGGKGKPRFELEARPGGRMYEDWGDGDGLLWGTVVNVQAGKRLDIVSTSGPQWGGPSTSFGSFELAADGAGTKLRFTESSFGRVGEATVAEKDKGWRFLLEGALRAHVEGKPAPAWPGEG